MCCITLYIHCYLLQPCSVKHLNLWKTFQRTDFVNLVFAEMLGELETNVRDSEIQEFSLLEIAVAISGKSATCLFWLSEAK